MDIRHLSKNIVRGALTSARMRRRGFTPSGYKIWSHSEENYVRQYYPDIAKIQQRFPHRTVSAIQAKASKLGVAKKYRPWTAAKVLLLRKIWACRSRSDIQQAFPEYSWERLRSKASSLRLRRPSQQLPAKHYLIEEIRVRGRSLDLTLMDIDRMTKNKSYFKNSIRKKNPRIDRLIQAIDALDGHIEIVWH